MNKSFKVVFSKARSALMVVNEATSSIQAKGTKTVIAVAAAMVAGGAMAETTTPETTAPTQQQLWVTGDVLTDQTITVKDNYAEQIKTSLKGGSITFDGGVVSRKSDQTAADVGYFTTDGTNITVKSGGGNFNWLKVQGGKLVVGGKDSAQVTSIGGYAKVDIVGADVTIGKNGLIWGGKGNKEKVYRDIDFVNSTVTLDGVAGENDLTAFKPKESTRAVIFGSFVKNNSLSEEELAQYENEGNKVVFTNTTVNVTGAGAVNALNTVVDADSTISIAKDKGDLLITSVSGLGDHTKMTPSDFTVKGTVINAGKLTSQVDDFVVEGKVTNTDTGVFDAAALTIADGGTFVNNGVLSVLPTEANQDAGVVIEKGGKLVTAISTAKADSTDRTLNYSVLNTTVNEGGVFQVTSLNSEIDGGTILLNGKSAGSPVTLNLNGGKIYGPDGAEFKGNLKLGTSTKNETAVVNFNKGDYTLNKLSFGSNAGSKTTVGADASLAVTTLDLSGLATATAAAVTNNGILTIGKAVFTPDDAEATLAEAVVANKGTIYTGYENLFTKDETTGKYTAASDFGAALKGTDDTGVVFETAYTGKITADQLKQAKDAVGNIAFLNATLTNADSTGNAEFSTVLGLLAPTATVDATTKAETTELNPGTDVTVVGNVNTTAAKTVTVKGTGLTIAGNNGVVFGAAATKVAVDANAALNLGYEQAVNNGTVKAEVTVGTSGALNINAGNWNAAGGVDLTDTTSNLNVTGASLDAAYVNGAGKVTITDGVVAVLGNKPVTADTPATAAAGDAADTTAKTFENAVNVTDVSFVKGNAPVANSNLFVVGTTAAAGSQLVADAYGMDADGKNVMVLTKQLVLGTGETAYELGKTDGTTANLVLVDMKSLAANAKVADEGVIKNSLSGTGTVTLANLDNRLLKGEAGAKTFKLASDVTGTGVTVDYGTFFYGTGTTADYATTGTLADGGTVSFVRNKNFDWVLEDSYQGDNVKAALDNVTFGNNKLVDAVVYGLPQYIDDVKDSQAYKDLAGSTDTNAQGKYLQNAIDVFNEQIDTASVMAAAGGAFSTALDINDQTTAAISRRASLANLNVTRNEAGLTPWVDVFGTTNEAKTLYGEGMGYEADIYGAVLGFDYTASCGGVIGLAVNVGTADANSKGLDAGVDTDTDFYGVSLYAAKQFGDFNVTADFGYTQTKNDFSMNTVFGNVSESEDADILTFGLGTEFLASAGMVNVVPHAGIRVTTIDMDASQYGADYDKMTVWQMPLGVAFSGTFDVSGMKVAPMVDVSVVPTFGDKNVEYTIGSTTDSFRVVDSNPVQATLGVSAQTGAFTFGLNYRLSAGSDDRMNNSFNANVRYTF